MKLRSLAFLLLCGVALSSAAAGCSTQDAVVTGDDAEIRALSPSEIVGSIGVGETKGPIAYTNPPRYRALSFTGAAGQSVEAWVKSSDGDAVAILLDASFKSLAENDDADATTKDARVTATLPASGTYYVAFWERDLEPATFRVSLALTGADGGGAPAPGTPCATLNAITKQACGACGERAALCLDSGQGSVWSEYGVCENEVSGGCVPGAVVDVPCGSCGTQRKTCNAVCGWDVSACMGQPANACAPGTTEFTAAACVQPDTYRQRTCYDSCTFSNFTATCSPPPSKLDIPAAVGGVTSTIVTFRPTQLAPHMIGSCTAPITFIGTEQYNYVTLSNMTNKTATISVYNTSAAGLAIADTDLVAYPHAPATDAERKVCLQMADIGTPALTGSYGLAALTGPAALVLGPNRSVTIYNGAPKAGPAGGAVQLNVKTEALF